MSGIYTLWQCLKCDNRLSLEPGQYTTCDLKVCCDQPMDAQALEYLMVSQPCGIEFLAANDLVPCHQEAHWLVNGLAVCDNDIQQMAGQNGDAETFLRPALDEIAGRKHQHA